MICALILKSVAEICNGPTRLIYICVMKKLIYSFLLCLFSLTTVFSQNNQEGALANQYFENAEYEKAITLYEKLNLDNNQYYSNYIASLTALKDYDKAEKIIKRQLKKRPTELRYQVDLGKLYQKSGNESKAKSQFQNAIKMLKPDQNQIAALATSFYLSEEPDFAIETYLEGRKLLKSPTAFVFELGRLYDQKADKTLLIDEYLNLLENNPDQLSMVQNYLSQSFIAKKDFDLLKTALFKRIQKNDQNPSFSALLIWQFLQQREFEMALIQTIAIDKREKEDGSGVLELARLLTNNEAYDVAAKAYQYLIDKGPNSSLYLYAKMEILNVKKSKITKMSYSQADIIALENDYQVFLTEFGKNTNTAFAMLELGKLRAEYLNKPKEAISILEELLTINGLKPVFVAESKIELGDIYILDGQVWESALLYGQVDKAFRDDPVGQMARFKNARLSYFTGSFDWAKSQLDVLKASTTQLISNDALNLSLLIADNTGMDTSTEALQMYSRAELLSFQHKYLEALKTLDSIPVLFPNHSLQDDILMTKARMDARQGNYLQAIVNYELIVSTYSDDIWADDALYEMAVMQQEKLNNPAKAMEMYEKLITSFPGSLYVVDARKKFRILRGDTIN